MTWCADQTDAERFATARTFYIRVDRPKRRRPGKHFSGFHKAVRRLPMPVWWTFCNAVRRQVFRTLADGMVVDGWLAMGCDGTREECPRSRVLEDDWGPASKSGSAPML